MAKQFDIYIARARSLLGTDFRLHGRDAAYGLDCVGLVALTYGLTNLPQDYPLNGGSAAHYMQMLGLFARLREGAPQAGDCLLLQLAPTHFHVGVWSGASLIHAHVGLRKVVETPGIWPGTLLGAYTPLSQSGF